MLISTLGEEPVSVSRLQALLDLIADEAEIIHLVTAEQPLPTLASRRYDLLIPVLPGTQRLRRNTEHPRYRPDAVDAAGIARVVFHPASPSCQKARPDEPIRPTVPAAAAT
jgi:hypothetical protein